MATTHAEEPEESSLPVAAPETELAYYTLTDAAYFLGTVALLNSLRWVGEDAPLFVVDCGLTPAQRQRLSTRATVVSCRADLHPLLQKATGPLAHPARVMVFIDSDILVTRPLAPLLREAEAGRIVAFEDFGNPDRFFDEWSSLQLGQARRRPYVNSGLFALSWETSKCFLPLFDRMQLAVDMQLSVAGGGSPSYPFYFPDQDILNAVLCACFDGQVTRLERRLAPFPPFPEIEIVDGDRTLCAYPDGVAPFVLHHTYRKPWLASLRANSYSRLFTFLVADPQACLPLGPRDLPPRLSNRPLARLDRWRAAKQHAAHNRLRGRLGIRPRVAKLRARIAP